MNYQEGNVVASGGRSYRILDTSAGHIAQAGSLSNSFDYAVQELNDTGELVGSVYYCYTEDIANHTIPQSYKLPLVHF